MNEYFKFYDRTQKQIVKHNIVVALIISLCFEEFSGISLQDIANYHLLETQGKDRSILLGEDGEINLLDRQVRFDSLFRVIFPDGKIGYLNIEVQNDGKDLQNIFGRSYTYSGVMITMQIGVEIINQQYENLKKTASLWLISDSPQNLEGNIYRGLNGLKNLIGETKINQELVDFINPIYIFLTKDGKIESEELKILSALLNPYMDHEIREEILKGREEYSIIHQEVLDMEGNGRAIYNKGIEKGKTDKALSFIKALLEEHYNYNQITSLLHLSKEESDKYRALLNLQK